jgi:prepilin-type N-terminal cleavage/methylation domain-containing protein
LKEEKRRAPRGFTLLEVLIVVIIIGIIATVGLINYTGVRERALGKEARANLKLVAAAERIYRMEYGCYYGPQAEEANINTFLKLSLPTAARRTWDYAITGGGTATPDQFSSTASRTTSTGATCTYTITQDQEEPTPGANCL